MKQWRDIPGLSNYIVSDHGDVIRARGKRARPTCNLRPILNSAGYLTVLICEGGEQKKMFIHRLVALAFLGEPPSSKHQIAHNDGNRKNNHVSNLRWATAKENMSDTLNHGTHSRGSRCGTAKLTENDVFNIRQMLVMGRSQDEIAREYGMSQQAISNIATGKSWK